MTIPVSFQNSNGRRNCGALSLSKNPFGAFRQLEGRPEPPPLKDSYLKYRSSRPFRALP